MMVRQWQRMAVLVGLFLLGRAPHVLAVAGDAPWDGVMEQVWVSITGGPFAVLVLGVGIIALGIALMASEHGSLWRGLPVFVIGAALIAGAQQTVPSFFGLGEALTIPM